MPQIRMTRTSGRRIITRPSQIVNAPEIKNCDFLAITPLQQREILMKNTEAELL